MLVSVGERGRVGIVVLKIWFKKSLWPPSTLRASGFSFSKFLCLRLNFIYYSTNIQHFTTYWMHKQVLAFNYLLWTWLQRSFSSVQLLSRVQLFATPWIAARQASMFIIISWSSPKSMSTELVMPSNHLILCCPLLLLPSIFPSIRVFSNESALCMRLPQYWSFSFNISPFNENPGLISCRMDWLDLLQSKGLLRVFSNTTIQKHQFFCA